MKTKKYNSFSLANHLTSYHPASELTCPCGEVVGPFRDGRMEHLAWLHGILAVEARPYVKNADIECDGFKKANLAFRAE